MIDSYNFGKIVMNGKAFNQDVIIYPDRVNSSWWRRQGHNLCWDDIREIIAFKPEILIIGKGQPGLMKVPADLRARIEEQGIKLFIAGTVKAVQKYNSVCESKRAVAALHLSC